MPPPRVRIARSGRVLREVRVLEDDHPADQVDALAVRHSRHLRRLVVVADGAGLPREWHAEGREPDLTALVLEVELDGVQPVLRQRDVLLELPRERRERARHVDAAHLDRERTWPDRDLDARRAVGRGLTGGTRSSLLALARERHPPCEREHDEQEEAGHGCATTTLSPAHRVPASAEALVRVQRWIQHGHRVQQCSRSVSNRDGVHGPGTGHAFAWRSSPATPRACNHPQGHPRCPDVTPAPNPCRVCAGTVPGR